MTPELSSNPRLDAALEYAQRYFLAVFPCFEITNGDCACPPTHSSRGRDGYCKSPGKHPRTSKGFLDATRDPVVIKRWFMRWPQANIGIATGVPSGIVVIDVDPRNGGEESFLELEQQYEELPDTPRQLTGGGGFHLVFLRPHVEYIAGKPLALGVDVKADGGYIIAAPSDHLSGRAYAWELTAGLELPLAPLPPWIAEKLARTRGVWEPSPCLVTDGYMGAAFEAAGWSLRPLGPTTWAVKCPWEEHHTSGVAGDSSTVVFAPPLGSRRGWFHCSHEHCRQRSQGEVVAIIPREADFVARKRLRLAKEFDVTKETGPPTMVGARQLEGDDWKSSIQCFGNGRISRTAGNATLFLMHLEPWQGTLEYDAFTDEVRWAKDAPRLPGFPGPRGGERLQDRHVLYVQQWFSRCKEVDFSKDIMFDAIDAAARLHTVHPVLRYLDGLVWDGVGRLGTWLSRYLGAPDHDLVHRIGVRWLVSAVARVKQPGCQADHLLILEGPQGVGKTEAIRTLGGEWYLGALPDLHSKDASQVLAGHWIVEVPELSALKGATLTRVKEWTTLRVDAFRPSYGRRVVHRPRQVVFIGTTNDAKYLTDVTGNRRFWPVRTSVIEREALRHDCDQLWAEAAVAYAAGVQWWPSAEEADEFALLQESRFREDIWETLVLRYLDGRPTVTTAEVLDMIGIPLERATRAHQMRVADILRRNGWSQRGRDEDHARRWQRGPVQEGLFS